MAAVEAATQPDLRASECVSSAYRRIRAVTTALCEPLEPEDYVVQSMPDASPAKWHLAHTTWFFEQFLLKPHLHGYRPFHPKYEYLFNSYYESVGPMHQRPERGLLTRPTVAEITAYREHVDANMETLIGTSEDDERLATLAILGLNHEQQHQELLLTDLKHLLSRNPLQPAYRHRPLASIGSAAPIRFQAFEGGVREIGATGKHFCFDNEMPRHMTVVESFALADRPVVNSEYLEFIREGGYRRPEFWLSDGWTALNREGWTHPLYWSDSLDSEFTLCGVQALRPAAPVCHISYYEADAFARWAGARLLSEAEWEIAAAGTAVAGNLLESGLQHPDSAASDDGTPALKQLFGDVWEWTASPYGAYPGFRPLLGTLGEYNGKFMCNQFVLRGGSCVTPAEHIRATYRNFFYPHARWQFTGVRLARDF
jgi:ergothioneine biosynthesis protein EgtB